MTRNVLEVNSIRNFIRNILSVLFYLQYFIDVMLHMEMILNRVSRCVRNIHVCKGAFIFFIEIIYLSVMTLSSLPRRSKLHRCGGYTQISHKLMN